MATKKSKKSAKGQITIEPRRDQVLIKPEETQKRGQTSAMGIIIPDNEEAEERSIGTVVAIGRNVEDDIKVGDKVIFGTFLGDKIKLDATDKSKEFDHIMVKDEEVTGFVR